ncbi:MAG: hypothetical protein ACMXYB_04790 [Candidatus Woesearchaeota archaeon]
MELEKISSMPTLELISVIELTIKKYDGECNLKQLFKKIPLKVAYKTFLDSIDYLLYSKKISIDSEGKIGWIFYPSSLSKHSQDRNLFLRIEE